MKRTKSNFRGNVINTAEKHEKARSSFGYLNLPKGIKAFMIKDGVRKVQLDIMPYIVSDPRHPDNLVNPNVANVGDLWYKRPTKIHRNVGAENETCICPKSVGKPCPICEYQKELFDRDKDDDRENAIELYSKDRDLYVVIPLDSDDHEEIPYVWDMAQSLFEDVLIDTLRESKNEENEIFASLEEGKTLEIDFRWKKLGRNKFPEATHIEFLDREPYDESILDEIPNLDEVSKVLSYKELQAKFFETELEEDAGELKEIEPEKEEVHERRRPLRSSRSEEKKEEFKPERGSASSTSRRSRHAEEVEPEKEERKPLRRSMRTSLPSPELRKTEPEKEVEETPKRSRRTPVKEEVKDANPCPQGFVYGVENDTHDECYDCTVFDDCYDEKRKIEKEKK
jgi:hypothetical protein